jgi:hypothetical protein
MERLPGAQESNVDIAIKNLEGINAEGILSIFKSAQSRAIGKEHDEFDTFAAHTGMRTSRGNHPGAHALMDRCFAQLGRSMRWEREAQFKCTCNVGKVWSALRSMPEKDLEDILTEFPVVVEVSLCNKTKVSFSNIYLISWFCYQRVNFVFSQTSCESCGKIYELPTPDIRKQLQAESSHQV